MTIEDWGVTLSPHATKRLGFYCSLTGSLRAEGWEPIDTAPKDGSLVDLRIVHINAAYTDRAKEQGWIATCPGQWTETPKPGWTWQGLGGRVVQWRPRRLQ